ncbi:MAG: potassium channel family protein [Ignavibacteria bacterium]|nr:potassium channel family protein [Ignavibacteria bacterium]
MLKKFRTPLALLTAVLFLGTFGYWHIGGGKYSLIDCLYMTVITILTIGYGEIIDLTYNSTGRLFTILIAFTGIGTATYIISTFTALIVEGQLKETFKKRRMKKVINKLENHYIICGAGRVGSVILNELYLTDRTCVVIDKDEEIIQIVSEKYPKVITLIGDADIEEVLENAGIKTAKGIFAATGDDNQNLVISLTAKYINPSIKVVARCLEAANQQKMVKAGADSVITENYIAGMRMASEMTRPAVVGFLDRLLTDKDKNLRVEEVSLHKKHAGKKLNELELHKYPNTLVLAAVTDDEWTYNPKMDHLISENCKIIVITNPKERMMLKELYQTEQ